MAKDRLLITGSSVTIGKILTERLSDSFELIGVDVVREETEIETYLAMPPILSSWTPSLSI